MNRTAIALAALLAAATLGSAARAQQHHGHGAPATATAADNAATKAYREANTRMHKDMDIAFTGDADADFVRGMIPHHQGAIDMAKVQQEYGKDPEIRKLAEEVIKAQEAEFAMMKAWLKSKGK